jgi:hypothetical protein
MHELCSMTSFNDRCTFEMGRIFSQASVHVTHGWYVHGTLLVRRIERRQLIVDVESNRKEFSR